MARSRGVNRCSDSSLPTDRGDARGALRSLCRRTSTARRGAAAAQEKYLEARAALPDRDALHRLLDEAITLDRDFAPAYALKAENYALAIAGAVARNDILPQP